MARLSAEDCIRFGTCLMQLLASGLPLLTALELLVEQKFLPDSLGKRTFEKISQGVSLSEAWRHEKVPKMLVAWLRTAEEQGDYVAGLQQSVVFYKTQVRFVKYGKQACRYPLLVLIMTAVVFVFLFTTLLPKLFELYNSLQVEPPVSLDVLIGCLIGVQGLGWSFPVFLFLGWRCLRRGYGWKWIQKVPMVGLVLRTFATHFVAQQLSASLRTGLPLLRGLALASDTAPWPQLGDSIKEVRSRVFQGIPLAQAWEGEAVFLPSLGHLIALGEAGGCCEALLDHLTVSTEKSIQQQLQRFLSWLEPLLLSFVSVGVALLVLLWLLPLLMLLEAV